MKSLRAWLGLDRTGAAGDQPALRQILDALDQLPADRARFLAGFAFLLGRVARADDGVSPEETRAMEELVAKQGHLPVDQAMLVVGLAKTSTQLFAGTADYLVAREFASTATYDDKLALLRCLFAVSAVDDAISIAEETEIHRIANELKIDRADIVSARVAFRQFLPGLHASSEEKS
ncbi:MAG TPA: TerB family tellurite resistance protein [Vicinamibacterales bacterium]|jgi:uncharacterized tellurite resistance protein B-like protein|nr:TerB family tellurite resistance protein [Vicinamibacterales bacterium]